jgi:deazaflavin-dependent oxidoreductase (nitroreductase family)
LAAVPLEGGSLYVVGSNFAREAHPAWTANLIAHPQAEVLFRGETTPMRARLLSDDEREAAWPILLRVFPAWERYTAVTDRRFRVFELAPVAPGESQL